jgi:hypothetical protein
VLALAGLAAVFAAAQLVRVPRTNPPVRVDLNAPTAVKLAMRRACYDCHSNETSWPWYSAVAPMSWVIHRHVVEARERLNFSEWSDYESDADTAAHKLDEIARAVTNEQMAPWYYRLTHPEARLDRAERGQIAEWARSRRAALLKAAE